MATWDSYTQKSTPADNDTLMIKDTSGGANKRTPFSGVWNWIVSKLASAVISQLETTNKSIIPAINELNSKSITNINQLISTYSVTGKSSKEIQLSEGVYIVSTSQYGGWDQTNKGFLVFASLYPQTNKITELGNITSQWISATISDKGVLTISNQSDATALASVFKVGGTKLTT